MFLSIFRKLKDDKFIKPEFIKKDEDDEVTLPERLEKEMKLNKVIPHANINVLETMADMGTLYHHYLSVNKYFFVERFETPKNDLLIKDKYFYVLSVYESGEQFSKRYLFTQFDKGDFIRLCNSSFIEYNHFFELYQINYLPESATNTDIDNSLNLNLAMIATERVGASYETTHNKEFKKAVVKHMKIILMPRISELLNHQAFIIDKMFFNQDTSNLFYYNKHNSDYKKFESYKEYSNFMINRIITLTIANGIFPDVNPTLRI